MIATTVGGEDEDRGECRLTGGPGHTPVPGKFFRHPPSISLAATADQVAIAESAAVFLPPSS